MNVLVIDDNPAFSALLEEMVIAAGHRAIVENSGESALLHYKIRHIDIVICDWSMPGMTGLDVCREIRAIPVSDYTYFIILTGEKTNRKNYLDAMKAGADDFLTKPIDTETMMCRLAVAERICRTTNRLTQLEHLIPICSHCNRIRRNDNVYEQMQEYVSRYYKVAFSHGICPDCVKKYYPEIECR
ncbi:MAG: response regulator [Elusimicrobiales bacterium]|nr:response regulator [Elusimicrobiales bacterium]